jgi:hypothetical protein
MTPRSAPAVLEHVTLPACPLSTLASLRPSGRSCSAARAAASGSRPAFGIGAVQELIGGTPVPGHLTTATQLVPGATFDPRGAAALHADCEVVVTVGPDELGVALELVDLARQAGDMEAIVTGNVLHLAFALGPTAADLPGEARLIVNGVVRARARVRIDHRATVEALTRILEAAGEHLQPGDRIITGSVVQVAVAPGDHVVAEIDGLGRADARIADRQG